MYWYLFLELFQLNPELLIELLELSKMRFWKKLWKFWVAIFSLIYQNYF